MVGNFRLPILSSSSNTSSYVRPADWLTLPIVVSGEQKVVLLHAVFDHDSNFCAFQCASNYTVDWGDGTSNNYAANVSAFKVFDYNYAGFIGTECTRGYRQAIVTITPQATFNLTKLDLNIKYSASLANGLANQWLDIKMAGVNFNILSISSTISQSKWLEQFDFIGTNAIPSLNGCFRNAVSLKKVVNLYSNNVTVFQEMFSGCSSLTTLPTLNISSIFTILEFIQSTSVQKASFMTSISPTVIANSGRLFYLANGLIEVPLIDTSATTTLGFYFSSCNNLKVIPLLNTSNNTSLSQFASNSGVQLIEALDCNLVTNFGSWVNNCPNLSRIKIRNIRVTLSIASCKLSKTAIQEVFGNLLTAVGQTITITGNYGADTAISKTSCGTTAGSTVITQTNTSSLAVGMLVSGTGISTAVAVTFQDTGDTVTLNAHGLVNGNIVSFPSITTTTGITINTPYYVVGSTTNTFQVSLTLGGSAISLTTDGTGTVAYGSYIQSIITNTSYTVDKPASATGTVTLTNRILDTSIATLKGWTVTG